MHDRLTEQELSTFFDRVTQVSRGVQQAGLPDGAQVQYALVETGVYVRARVATTGGTYSADRIVPWEFVARAVVDPLSTTARTLLSSIDSLRRKR